MDQKFAGLLILLGRLFDGKRIPIMLFLGSLIAYIANSISSILFRGLIFSTIITAAYLFMNRTIDSTIISKLKTKVHQIRSAKYK